MKDLEENQDYIIELLHEIIDISRNKGPMISPNLMNESKNLMNESTWIPPDRPGISNSLPIIHSHRIYDKKKHFMSVLTVVLVLTCFARALRQFGKVKHIHSRKPPDKLEYIGNEHGGNTYCEWFNGILIDDCDLDKYVVLYIYRNPCRSIPSRFENPRHLEHIQCDPNIKLEHVLKSGKDLYNIIQFYYNYTTTNKRRNYNFYCLKYEDIFDKQDEIAQLLKVENTFPIIVYFSYISELFCQTKTK